MSDYNLSNVSLQRMHHMLRGLAELAHHASITGFLKQGKRSAMQRYNAILASLEQNSYVPPGLFQTLSEEASFDELNIESTLLARYIEEDVKQVRKEQTMPGPAAHADLESVIEEVRELKELKEAVREHMPELLEHRAGAKEAVLAELQELRELRSSISALIPEMAGGQTAGAEPPPASNPAATRADLERHLAEIQKRLAEADAQEAR